jgi:hypothetical protein
MWTRILLALATLASQSNAQVLQHRQCRLVTFIPSTDDRGGVGGNKTNIDREYGYGTWSSAEALAKAGFSLMAAAEMAKRHFNARDATIVPELTTLGQCNITFPEVSSPNDGAYLNSAYDRRVT